MVLLVLMLSGGAAAILTFWIRPMPPGVSASSQKGALQEELPIRLPEPEELGIVLPPEAFAPPETAPEVPSTLAPPASQLSPGSKEETGSAHPSQEELKRMEKEGIFSN